jgi:hypothetical protein
MLQFSLRGCNRSNFVDFGENCAGTILTVENSRSQVLKARYARVGEVSPELSVSRTILRWDPANSRGAH